MLKEQSWERLFQEYKESGLSRQQFCKEKAVSYNRFQYYWHRGNKEVEVRKRSGNHTQDYLLS